MIAFYEKRRDDFYASTAPSQRRLLQCAAHLHYHIELVFLLEGEVTAFAGTESYELKSGDVFLAFPNQIHRFVSRAPERYHILIVSPELVPDLMEFFTDREPHSARIAGGADDPELLQLVERLIALQDAATTYEELTRKGYLQALLARLLDKLELLDGARKDSHALQAIISYCSKHYKTELSLALLEQELHISKYYISHLFSDKLHISFNDYVNSLRVSHACRYLRDGTLSVTEVAAKVGFGTLRTFNRAFSKQIGCTPSAYRAGQKANNRDLSEKRGIL